MTLSFEPPLKKQRTDSFDEYYGDQLSNQDLESSLGGLFPNQLCADLAKIIIETFDVVDFARSAQVCRNWNLVANHHLAARRAEIYKSVFSPEDWNQKFPNLIPKEEMKHAFRSIPLNIDTNNYSVAWRPENMKINGFGELLKQQYKTFYTYLIIEKEVARLHGDNKFDKGWIAIAREGYFKNHGTTDNQNSLLENFNRETSKIHTLPKLLDAAICIFAEDIKFNDKLVYGFWLTCQETVTGQTTLIISYCRIDICIYSPGRGFKISVAAQFKL